MELPKTIRLWLCLAPMVALLAIGGWGWFMSANPALFPNLTPYVRPSYDPFVVLEDALLEEDRWRNVGGPGIISTDGWLVVPDVLIDDLPASGPKFEQEGTEATEVQE